MCVSFSATLHTETLWFCLTVTTWTMPFRIKRSFPALLILFSSPVLKCFANQQDTVSFSFSHQSWCISCKSIAFSLTFCIAYSKHDKAPHKREYGAWFLVEFYPGISRTNYVHPWVCRRLWYRRISSVSSLDFGKGRRESTLFPRN